MHVRGRISVACKGGSAWGGVYYDSGVKGGWSYPAAFTVIKTATSNIERTNGEFWVLQSDNGTLTTAPKFLVATGDKNTESVKCYAHVDAWGTWKDFEQIM